MLYLHLEAAGYGMLVEAERTGEVWSVAARPDSEVVHWRGRFLPLFDLGILLGPTDTAMPAGGQRVLVAYGEGEATIALSFDRLLGPVRLEAGDWSPPPRLSEQFAALFDAVSRRPIGELHPLRLRAWPELETLRSGAPALSLRGK